MDNDKLLLQQQIIFRDEINVKFKHKLDAMMIKIFLRRLYVELCDLNLIVGGNIVPNDYLDLKIAPNIQINNQNKTDTKFHNISKNSYFSIKKWFDDLSMMKIAHITEYIFGEITLGEVNALEPNFSLYVQHKELP
jgi:hypothetical protein